VRTVGGSARGRSTAGTGQRMVDPSASRRKASSATMPRVLAYMHCWTSFAVAPYVHKP